MSEELSKLKVAELRQLCKDRGLETSGVKAVLVSRLAEADRDSDEEVAVADDGTDEKTTKELEKKLENEVEAEAENGVEEVEHVVVGEVERGVGGKSAAETTGNVGDADPVSVSKLLARKERFGQVESGAAARDPRLPQSTVAKEALNAENVAASSHLVALEKLKARAARFGTTVSPALAEAEAAEAAAAEAEKKRKRAERFGGEVPVDAAAAGSAQPPAKERKVVSLGADLRLALPLAAVSVERRVRYARQSKNRKRNRSRGPSNSSNNNNNNNNQSNNARR